MSRPIALGYSRGSTGAAERTGRNTPFTSACMTTNDAIDKPLQFSANRPWFLLQNGPKTQTDRARRLCGMVGPGAWCRSRRLHRYGAPSWFKWVWFGCCRGFGASAQEAQNFQATQVSVPWLRFRPENHHRLPRAHEEEAQSDRCERCVELPKNSTLHRVFSFIFFPCLNLVVCWFNWLPCLGKQKSTNWQILWTCLVIVTYCLYLIYFYEKLWQFWFLPDLTMHGDCFS